MLYMVMLMLNSITNAHDIMYYIMHKCEIQATPVLCVSQTQLAYVLCFLLFAYLNPAVY